jgi:two-component system phosphate regulon sensor histidine kinase PhoR
MLRSRFFWKVYAVCVAVIVVTAAIMDLLLTNKVEQDLRAEIRQSLEVRTRLLRAIARSSLLDAPEPDFQTRIRDLGQETGTRFTVIRADGTVIADSQENPASMDNHGRRPEVLEALTNSSGMATRLSATTGFEMMYCALTVPENGRVIGFVRVSIPLQWVQEWMGHLRRLIAFGAILAAGCSLILGLFFTRRVTQPLHAITVAAEAIAGGDYGRRVRIDGSDEIGKLARAFNTMAGEMRERMETVTRDRNQLAAILGGMVEGVVAIDQNERILHLNDVARRLLGVPRDGGIGKPVWEATRLHTIHELLGRAMRTGQDIVDDLHVPFGARDLVVGVHASPLRSGEGQVVGAVVVLHDVTELRRLEAVRRDFVANVSHELKTPLTAIHGIVETLLDDEAMEAAQQRRFLAKIHDQSAQMATLVTDLLTLARVESKESALSQEPLDLREQATESARLLQPEVEAKGHRLTLDLPDSPVRIVGDEKAVRQIIGNLLDNAIKYTPEGGRIGVRVRAEGEQAVIEVQDTGIGIEPRHQDRIFERFYRVDKGRSRALGGTGLGLSIVKHMTSALGGEVAVESTPGEGSTFRVRLPLAAGEPAHPDLHQAAREADR